MRLLIPIVLALLFLSPIVLAQQLPKPINYVSDFANVIDDNSEALINSVAAQIEKNSTAQIFVATFQSTDPYTSKEYATKLFNEWKIGQKGVDNGILILIALEPERRWEVETGYGVEGILPDSKVGRLMREYLVPDLKENKYGEGLLKAVTALGAVIMSNGEFSVSEGKDIDWSLIIFFFIFVLIIVSAVASDYKSAQKCDTCKVKMKTEKVEETQGSYYVYTYVCPKCGKKKIVKRKRSSGWGLLLIGAALGGSRGGGGFGGGGGGGGSGGGGSGGSF